MAPSALAFVVTKPPTPVRELVGRPSSSRLYESRRPLTSSPSRSICRLQLDIDARVRIVRLAAGRLRLGVPLTIGDGEQPLME
eukprot:2032459-Prymnesium_polylepis.2